MNLPNIIQINLQNYVATVLDDTESMTSVDVTNFRGKLFDVILNVALTMLRTLLHFDVMDSDVEIKGVGVTP